MIRYASLVSSSMLLLACQQHGSTDSSGFAELRERVALEVSSLAPFEVRLGGARVFPSPRSPRVIAVAVEPEAPLASLAAGVEQGVVAAGQKPERRRFRAHLTLGRVRNRRFPSVGEAAAIDGPVFTVEEIVLYQSELHRSGAVYTPLERIALRGQSPGEGPRSQTETSQGELPLRDSAQSDSP